MLIGAEGLGADPPEGGALPSPEKPGEVVVAGSHPLDGPGNFRDFIQALLFLRGDHEGQEADQSELPYLAALSRPCAALASYCECTVEDGGKEAGFFPTAAGRVPSTPVRSDGTLPAALESPSCKPLTCRRNTGPDRCSEALQPRQTRPAGLGCSQQPAPGAGAQPGMRSLSAVAPLGGQESLRCYLVFAFVRFSVLF